MFIVLFHITEFGRIFYVLFGCTFFKEIAKKRVAARGQRKVSSRNGSKSTARYHLERGEDLDSSSGQLETWRLTHYDEEKGWISNDVEALYVSIL
jgi:hypothetical protein